MIARDNIQGIANVDDQLSSRIACLNLLDKVMDDGWVIGAKQRQISRLELGKIM